MKGPLSEGTVPHLLRAIYVGRRTGSLHVANGDVRHGLRFRRGQLVNARTNVPGERLGEMMVRRGLLGTTDLARATTQVIRTRKRLGAVLLEMGVVDPDRLQQAIETHVRELLSRLVTWTQGSYDFEEEGETDPELTLELSTGELILEAVRAVRDPRVVHEALGDTDRVLAHSADPALRFQKLTLSPADGFVLSRIDGTTSAREVVQLISLPAEEVERSLLNLLSTGVIEFTAAVRRAGAPAAAASGKPPVVTPSQAGTARADAAPAPATPAATPNAVLPPATEPGPPRPADDVEGRRREILEAAQGLKQRNHFEVLGLARGAREAEVKDAYFRLAKRFHPDAHHSADLADLRDELEAVFIRLGEAYEVLRDPRKRGEYEERLGRPRGTTPVTGQAQAAEPPHPSDGEAATPAGPELEEIYRSAARHHEAERYWDAIQCLEPVADKASGKLGSAILILLARCYLRNPNWARRAEEMLLGVTRNDPASVEAWALLASMYAEKGMRNRACSMYRRVLELRHEHAEAAAYVATYCSEDPAHPADETPGMLRRLFRRS